MPARRRLRTDEMMTALGAEVIETWFDLGLFIDRLREDRCNTRAWVQGSFGDFRREVSRGLGFVTFFYGVDGSSMEIAKYASAFRDILPDVPIHYIAGDFTSHATTVIDPSAPWHRVECMNGFDDWPLYADFFERKLERGSSLYNDLIDRFWSAVLETTRSLGEIVEQNDIRLLYLVNVSSNPGNPALALACVFVSEYLRIPIVNNCHDYYWEGGHSEVEREVEGIASGPRDHFFTNSHLGEVFSILQMIYPWDSRSWMTVNINWRQSTLLADRFGHNPASICKIPTGIDTERYAPLGQRRRTEVWLQIGAILRGPRSHIHAVAVREVIEEELLHRERRQAILIGARSQANVDFSGNNSIFLQPTRIIRRKRIELSLELIAQLFEDAELARVFRADPSRQLTLLVTGPVAIGHDAYLDELLRAFEHLVARLDAEFRDRVYLALLFSEFDSPSFREGFEQPIEIFDIYGVASVVTLPSDTEGRGLPIIESAACGVPILTRRYEPQEVFQEVVGEHLAREDRLEVSAFSGSRIDAENVDRVKQWLLEPGSFREFGRHNRRVVERRFSMQGLARELEGVLYRLYLQLQPDAHFLETAARALTRFRKRIKRGEKNLSRVLNADNREYLPCAGRMAFMLMLKSLIDPSFFRVEEQLLRGMAFSFARSLVDSGLARDSLEVEKLSEFYNCVESLFLHRRGEMAIQFDHAFAYRHRNRMTYPYRDLTPQELTGVVSLLFRDMFGPIAPVEVAQETAHHPTDWHRMVAALCGGSELAIDDRDKLLERLRRDVPVAYFPGSAIDRELEVFVLQPVRLRLGLGLHEEITEEHLSDGRPAATITIIARREALGDGITAGGLRDYLSKGPNQELRLLLRRRVCRVVGSGQLSVGIDFRQLGHAALGVLAGIREEGGFLVAAAQQAAVTTDIIGLECFHLGRASDPLTANIMGIPVGGRYIQWSPAGLRCTLAYPTPVQTARSLSETLQGQRFRQLCARLGEDRVLEALREDAEQRGSPAHRVLEELASSEAAPRGVVEHGAINGVYADGHPWSGVIAVVRPVRRPLRYRILSAEEGNQTVLEFVEQFNAQARDGAKIAWNGGYILNAELVGKLGLPESYIGSPLGLLVSDGRVLCPPLFNKPAFIVAPDGSLAIRRVSCAQGLSVSACGSNVHLDAAHRNGPAGDDAPCFYDLLYPGDTLPGEGRSIVRLVGNRIMEVLATQAGEEVPVLPVGLSFSFAPGTLPAGWGPGTELDIELPGLSEMAHAVEAGPMLLEDGESCIDMETEGWKTRNSILTQAARLDYLDMRGPKIAIGLDAENALAVLAVNGRIRESVGATHIDMAEILRSRGMRSAMGFDPGGSSTLVVGTETLNISPYNRDYERNVYALAPQPRAVANAVVGY